MKIAAIRNAIDHANYARRDLTGGTASEFRNQAVGPRLAERIAELQSLQIAPRFARDIERRDYEIATCTAVIGRWHGARAAAALTPAGGEL